MKTNLKIITAVCVVAFSSQASAAFCPVDTYTPIQHTTSKVTKHTADVIKRLKGMDLALNASVDNQTKAIVEAIDILSTQKALSSRQLATAVKNNTHVQAQAIQEVNRTKRMKKAARQYGKQGAGYKACAVLEGRAKISTATKSTELAVPDMVASEITARSGSYSSSKDAAAVRLALHDKYYCTSSQAASGLCTSEAPYAGQSLQAATLFEPSGWQDQGYQAKSAFINNMVGLPDDPVPQRIANSIQAQSYSDLKRRKDAIKSAAIVSLKSIQAQTSSVPSIEPEDAGNGTITAATKGVTERQQLDNNPPPTDPNAPDPLMIQIKTDVNRYLGGGAEHQEWAKTVAGLDEKGVLTELVKIKAGQNYMQAEKYKQYARMEAMLASVVAAQMVNSGLEGAVEEQRQVALRSNIKDTIRSRAQGK